MKARRSIKGLLYKSRQRVVGDLIRVVVVEVARRMRFWKYFEDGVNRVCG